MQTIGAFEAKTHLSSLLVKVEHGEQIIITKHGKPIAKLTPIEECITNKKSRPQIIEHLKGFSKGNKLNGLDLKQLINEGRL